jgi:predicted dehydrogenase
VGKPVVCEKPLATSVEDARGLTAKAAAAALVATVPFVYRFYPTVREARARIAAGQAGPLRLLHERRHAVPHGRHHRPSTGTKPRTTRPSPFHQPRVGGADATMGLRILTNSFALDYGRHSPTLVVQCKGDQLPIQCQVRSLATN